MPVVLIFIDAIGLRPRLQDMADRLAAGCCAVLVPNLLYRAGRAPVVPDVVSRLETGDHQAVFQELEPSMAALSPQAAARDTQA